MKTCKACGATLERRENEGRTSFSRRRNCNRVCGDKSATLKRLGHLAPMAILTEREVRRIKGKLAEGVKMKVLAEEHGVSVGTIQSIKCGASWRHVD